MWYFVAVVGGFVLGMFIVSACTVAGREDDMREIARLRLANEELRKRLAEAPRRTVTLRDETGMTVEMPVEGTTS